MPEHVRALANLQPSDPPPRPPTRGQPSRLPSDTEPPSRLQLKERFGTFVSEHFERGMLWARQWWVPVGEREDVVQDALLTMCANLRDRGTQEWLEEFRHTIGFKLLGRYRDHARWKKREPILMGRASLLVPPANGCPETVLEDRRTLAKIGRIIEALPPERNDAAWHYFVENETMCDIAERQGVGVETVKTRIKLARADIEAALARDEAKEQLHGGGVTAFLLILLGRVLAFFRRGDARHAIPAAQNVATGSGPSTKALHSGHRVVAFVTALAGLIVLALWVARSGAPWANAADSAGVEAITADEPIEHVEVDHCLFQPFLTTWAEREKENGGGAAPIHRAPLADGAAPSAAPLQPTVPIHPLLSKAREALLFGRLTEAAAALHDYEVNHPDPTANTLHRDLRVELERRGLDKAPLLR